MCLPTALHTWRRCALLRRPAPKGLPLQARTLRERGHWKRLKFTACELVRLKALCARSGRLASATLSLRCLAQWLLNIGDVPSVYSAMSCDNAFGEGCRCPGRRWQSCGPAKSAGVRVSLHHPPMPPPHCSVATRAAARRLFFQPSGRGYIGACTTPLAAAIWASNPNAAHFSKESRAHAAQSAGRRRV